MKRIIFYSLLLLQIFIILFLTYQFEKIDETGQFIQLETVEPEYPIDDFFYSGSMYVDYTINQIPMEKWNKPKHVDYNNRVYVVLKSDSEGMFHVKDISTKKVTKYSDDEVIVNAFYHYTDEQNQYHYVNYGFEEINDIEKYGKYNSNDILNVSLLIGKWGQYKVISVEKVNK